MRKYTICLAVFILVGHFSWGQNVPTGGQNLVKTAKLQNYNVQKADWGGIKSEKNSLRVTTQKRPKFIYNLAASIPLRKRKIKKGDLFLLQFRAKTQKASLETGEAKANWILKQSKGYKGNLAQVFSIANKWQTYYLPIQATENIRPEDLALVLQFGYPPQEFLLKDVALFYYGNSVDIQQLPRTKITYQGQEEGAAWRSEALERIDSLRKTAFTIRLKDEKGKPIEKVVVQAVLEEHDFKWGAAVSAKDLLENPAQIQYFRSLFNIAVFENDLKIKRWSFADKRTETMQALELMHRADIAVKGHVLIWPGFRYLTNDFQQLKNQPEATRTQMQNHVRNILEQTKGQISHWDVVNEAYTNQDLQKVTGSEEVLYDGFRIAKEIDPKVGRFVNDFGIISKGGIDEEKRKWYYEYIQRIDENTGGLVNGLGLQCHMGSDLTPPEKVLEILDYYSTLGKQISISEFTMEIDDPILRKQYTRDFIIAAFSHPSVSEFLFWGFYGPTHPKADIFKDGWQLGSMGEAFYYLTQQLWKTQIVAATDEAGELRQRGFYGRYSYSFMHNNRLQSGTFRLQPEDGNTIEIQVK